MVRRYDGFSNAEGSLSLTNSCLLPECLEGEGKQSQGKYALDVTKGLGIPLLTDSNTYDIFVWHLDSFPATCQRGPRVTPVVTAIYHLIASMNRFTSLRKNPKPWSQLGCCNAPSWP